MSISSIFNNNRTQAVRLPAEVRFPDTVKKVEVRAVGQERIIAPAESARDSFFIAAQAHSAGLTLVSNNLREFTRAPGLLVENWVE
jgi:virulence-associated protein VagC